MFLPFATPSSAGRARDSFRLVSLKQDEASSPWPQKFLSWFSFPCPAPSTSLPEEEGFSAAGPGQGGGQRPGLKPSRVRPSLLLSHGVLGPESREAAIF